MKFTQQELFMQKSERYFNFLEYHEKNPQIWEAFKTYTFKAINRGHTRLSAEFIVNIIRWESKVSAMDEDFKINNNYKSYYSRFFTNLYPTYKNLFEVRSSPADELNITHIKTK